MYICMHSVHHVSRRYSRLALSLCLFTTSSVLAVLAEEYTGAHGFLASLTKLGATKA